jgi:hypothetical protein
MGVRAGVAVGDITPDLSAGTFALAGYGDRVGPADSVHDPLSVRALVLDDDETGVVVALVALDLLLLTVDAAARVRSAVVAALGVDGAQVLTSCVHLHAAPSTVDGGEQVGWPVTEGYLDRVADVAADAARRALASCRAVTARFGRAELGPGVAVNRRGHPFDPSVAVLGFDGSTGERVATVVSVGMHPTVSGPTNRAVATDWVGPCRDQLEQAFGGVAVLVQGCGGDVNPAVTAWDDGDPAHWAPAAAEVGAEVAAAVAAAGDCSRPVHGGLRVVADRHVAVTLDGSTLLSALAEGGPVIEVELIEWLLGDVTVLNVPGEGFHHLEQAIRAARGDRLFFVGLAPDWHGYLPVPFEPDSYEETLSYGPGPVAALGAALVSPPSGS